MGKELSDTIEKLKIVHERLKSRLPRRGRPAYAKLEAETERAVLLTGPRGVGKTTYLLQRSSRTNLLYFSADNPLASSIPLFDLAEAAFMEGYQGVFIDEVHYAKDWARHLKALYDSFPDQVIWASDSSAIVLRTGLADVSRRFIVRRLPLLSLREFAVLNGADAETLPVLDPMRLDMAKVKHILRTMPVLKHCRDWLNYGLRPIFLEGIETYPEKLLNVIEKTIAHDIPFLVPQLTENHLRLMSAVIGYLAKSSVPTLSVNSLCNEWGIGKEKLYSLLNAMEEAQILRVVRKKNDHKIHSVGAKIFFHDPSVYAAVQGDLGSVREAVVVASFQEANRKMVASNDERICDFVADGKWKLEIGGHAKKPKQADFVIRDRVDVPLNNLIPLWTLGFMW